MKKQIRKFLATLLTVAMVLSLVPAFTIPASAASSGNIIDLSDASPAASGNAWTYATENNGDGVYTITGNNVNLTITGSSVVTAQNTSSKRVVVDGASGAIAFNNLRIEVPEYSPRERALPPFELKNGANVEITLVGENILKSYAYGSPSQGTALAVPGGTTVTITSATNGALTATGGYLGAGIGGILSTTFGAINISGNAKITATGGEFGAGIGGSYSNTVGGTISIGGNANVIATGSHGGAGIGGGGSAYIGEVGGAGGTIIIGGNAQVTATGASGGAGIGAGNTATGTTDITIGGDATVIASGGTGGDGSGIGGGYVNTNRGGIQTITVTIGGNTQVTATGGTLGGAGIGTGYSETTDGAKSHDLTVNIGDNATVVATASGAYYANNSPGIGLAGQTNSAGIAKINITSTNVTATASSVSGKDLVSDIGASESSATVLYPVTIVGGGAGATATGNYYETAATVDINAGTKSGYTFKEWTTEDSGFTFDDETEKETFFTMPAKAVTVTATWTQNPSYSYDTYYNVAFNSNGGSAVSSKSVIDGGRVAKPADPTKADYTFGGWFTDAELTKEYDFTSKVTKNFTLYAKWVAGEVEPEPETPDEAIFPFDDVNSGHWFYDDVAWAWENGLLTGTSATKFSPSLNTTRATLATLVYRLEGEPTVTGTNTFTDVLDNYWYTDAITWAEANGVVKGYSDTIFAPDKDITREELVTLLWRYAGSPAVGGGVLDAPFADTNAVSDYAKDALAWAISIGIVQGDDAGRLNPQNPAARAEVAAVFRRYAEKVK